MAPTSESSIHTNFTTLSGRDYECVVFVCAVTASANEEGQTRRNCDKRQIHIPPSFGFGPWKKWYILLNQALDTAMNTSIALICKLLVCLLVFEIFKQTVLGPAIIFLCIYILFDCNTDHDQALVDSKEATMSTSPSPPNHDHDHPHFEDCGCLITLSTTRLPLHSREPTTDDPVLHGPCIYHHRTATRDEETAIFIQMAPEIDELKEVLSSGMVRFKRSGSGGQIVLRKATPEQIHEAQDSLRVLIAERERLVRELWGKFVVRWGGRVERRDDGTMFVVDAGTVEEEGSDEEGRRRKKEVLNEDVKDDEADPYVKRMREVQARMDDLKVADERMKAKRAKAGKAAEEYNKEGA
jgi:hypothetical protein